MHERLELVASVRVRDLFCGITLEQHRQYTAAILDCVIGFGGDAHAVGSGGRARGDQLRRAFHLHEADSTVADDRSFGYQHNVGTSIESARAASRIVDPAGTVTERPSIVSVGIKTDSSMRTSSVF
jgi:hypothetical protein